MIDPRFKSISIEISIAVVVFLAAFQYHVVPIDVRNAASVAVFALFGVELVRILIKLRRLRHAGVNVDNEGLKSPMLYGINKNLGEFDFQWKKNTRLLDLGMGIVLSAMAVVVVLLVVAAIFIK